MNLRTHRLTAGLSQQALGELTGLHQATISRIESGKHNVTLEQLRRIGEALGVSLQDLVNEDKAA